MRNLAVFATLSDRLMTEPSGQMTLSDEEHAALYTEAFQEFHRHRKDAREDAEMFFRCGMQLMRHLAKRHGFTIRAWPEN